MFYLLILRDFLKNIYFFRLSWVLVVACRIFSVAAYKIFICNMPTLSYSMWDLIPPPGIEPGPPALGVGSLSHWTTREVPVLEIFEELTGTHATVIEILFYNWGLSTGVNRSSWRMSFHFGRCGPMWEKSRMRGEAWFCHFCDPRWTTSPGHSNPPAQPRKMGLVAF